jgi:hypothetical protein
MTAKQLAQRIGCTVTQLNFEIVGTCVSCRKMGGGSELKCSHAMCTIPTILVMQEGNDVEAVKHPKPV